MGENIDPWRRLPRPAWRLGSNLSCPSNPRPPDIGHLDTNSMVFPPYSMLFPGIYMDNLIGRQSGLLAASTPMYGMPGIDVAPKRFCIFDQYWNQTNPTPIQAAGLHGSNKTNVTAGNCVEEEMHEDTEEINALLYSDSEASTRQSPVHPAPGRAESVGSSAARPAKKQRLNSDLDTSLVDTACSARTCLCLESDAESRVSGMQEAVVHGSSGDLDEQLKREKIQETVGLLRKIIPGAAGKDAASVLDEAISYLKYLKLKAEALGATSL